MSTNLQSMNDNPNKNKLRGEINKGGSSNFDAEKLKRIPVIS